MNKNESKILDNLIEFGLKIQEAQVYLVCLKLGQSTVSRISNESLIQRTFVYDILRSLINKGLASYNIIKGVNHYSVVSIDRFKYIQGKKISKLKEMLPEIRALEHSVGDRPNVRFFEGKEGLLEAQFDTLDLPKDEEILAYAASSGLYYEDSGFAKNYIRARVKRKIHVRAIMPDSPALKTHIADNQKELRQSLIVPSNKYPFTNEIDIYGNKVAILSYTGELVAVIIESESIAKTQRMIFELAWLGAKEYSK